MCTVFVCGGVFLGFVCGDVFLVFVCGDVFLACSTGRTPSLLPLFHLRHHVSSFAAGQGESSERACNLLGIECLSADHKSQRSQNFRIEKLAKNHMVCGAHILSYWCPEQRRFRRSRVVRWPRLVFVFLFSPHVSERGRAALSFSMFPHFLQSAIYSQLFLGFKAAPRVHCRLRRQHCDTPLVCARVCFRFFLCPSPSSRRVPTWRVRGHAVAPSLVLYLQVHKAVTIIPDLSFA